LFKLQAEFIAVLREVALYGSPQQCLARKAGIASGVARRALRGKTKPQVSTSPGVLNASTPVGKTDVTI
jgi:DNA-binding phage protein